MTATRKPCTILPTQPHLGRQIPQHKLALMQQRQKAMTETEARVIFEDRLAAGQKINRIAEDFGVVQTRLQYVLGEWREEHRVKGLELPVLSDESIEQHIVWIVRSLVLRLKVIHRPYHPFNNTDNNFWKLCETQVGSDLYEKMWTTAKERFLQLQKEAIARLP